MKEILALFVSNTCSTQIVIVFLAEICSSDDLFVYSGSRTVHGDKNKSFSLFY